MEIISVIKNLVPMTALGIVIIFAFGETDSPFINFVISATTITLGLMWFLFFLDILGFL